MRQSDTLRKITKQIQESKERNESAALKQLNEELNQQLQTYVPLLMAQAKIYWDLENYEQVEKVFRKSVDFCVDNNTWKLNVAHTLFMQVANTNLVIFALIDIDSLYVYLNDEYFKIENRPKENKFKEATAFYEPLVKQSYDSILDVSAVVLANLCVSYIMIGQNEDAEELMRKIEKEEEQLLPSEPEKRTYHLCIVNLVIGTLYCSKGTALKQFDNAR